MKPGLVLAATVVIASNAFVLVGVARNRTGTPVETIQLTQRELPTAYHEKEDTGVSLRMNWNIGFTAANGFSWLDRAKLESLGFDAAAALRDAKHQPLPRPAFIVFEYNGPAWNEWLKNREAQFKVPGFDASALSRLVPIDAGTSPEPLLQKYPDRQRYLIVRGVIRTYVNTWDPLTRKPANRLEGAVSEVLPQNIQVPPPLGSAFTKSTYSVTLNYGHRLEPWVSAQP